jgi:predicted alpha/beta-hydrolase family hydrolase
MGDVRLLIDPAADPRATLVLGHGAGGQGWARDLTTLASELPADGISVIRLDQPWRVAGRKVAPRPPVLDEGWLGAMEAMPVAGPLIVGGRSAGARVACRTALQVGAAAVVAVAFPLHLPGRPERSRVDELVGAGVPTLVLQGEQDSFGRPEEFPSGTHELVTVPHADHGMAVPKAYDQAVALELIVQSVSAFVRKVIARV